MGNNTPDYENNLAFSPRHDETNVANNVANANSQDLTEQWKNGELPSDWYYTKLWKGCNVIDKFIGNQFLRYNDSDIVEIITKVPSYEEWQEINKRLKDTQNLELQVRKENQQLKELLKECKEEIKPFIDFFTKKPTFASLIAEIDNAIGEKK